MDINIRTQLKSFHSLEKKINIFLISFLLLTIGCKKTESNFDTDDIIFKNIIENDLAVFKRYDSVNYKRNEYYQKVMSLTNSADNIIESIKNSTLSKDSVTLFNHQLNEYCRMQIFSFNYDKFKETEKSVMIYKIRTFQTIAVNAILNIYKDNYYPMELVKPIIVPRKDVINLGEKFIADVYLVGNNYTNKYMVVMNKDTLKYNRDSNFPVYEVTATNKGEKIIKGTMQIYHPGINSTFTYDISSKYIVK